MNLTGANNILTLFCYHSLLLILKETLYFETAELIDAKPYGLVGLLKHNIADRPLNMNLLFRILVI